MITELDQQQLDELLDGQLAPVEVQRLTRRLSAEPELAAELESLRSARAVRQNVFAALAPEPAATEAFSRRVISASRRQALRSRFGGPIRIGGGFAACIALGFFAGWFGRGHAAVPTATNTSPAIEKHATQNSPMIAVANHPDASPAATPALEVTGPYQVWATGADGRAIPVAKFDSVDEVNAFKDYVVREARRQDANIYSQPVASAARF